MGTCGDKNATLTKTVLESENKDKNESLKLEQPKNEIKDNKIKRNELKESKTLKEVKPNIDSRSSQAPNYDPKEGKDLKDASNIIDLFEKPIDIYDEPGKPYPTFVSIYSQLADSLCRITNKNNKVGIGFFCLIPFPAYDYCRSVLITNNYVLEKDEILPGKKVNITLNSKQKIELLLDDSRLIYNKNEIIIIEINKNDGLDEKDFLLFTNINNVHDCRNMYFPQNPYFFHYTKDGKIDYCLGLLQNIDKYNYK